MAKITEEISAKVFTEKSWHQRLVKSEHGSEAPTVNIQHCFLVVYMFRTVNEQYQQQLKVTV